MAYIASATLRTRLIATERVSLAGYRGDYDAASGRAPTVSRAIIVIQDGTIRAAGPATAVPIPAVVRRLKDGRY